MAKHIIDCWPSFDFFPTPFWIPMRPTVKKSSKNVTRRTFPRAQLVTQIWEKSSLESFWSFSSSWFRAVAICIDFRWIQVPNSRHFWRGRHGGGVVNNYWIWVLQFFRQGQFFMFPGYLPGWFCEVILAPSWGQVSSKAELWRVGKPRQTKTQKKRQRVILGRLGVDLVVPLKNNSRMANSEQHATRMASSRQLTA